MASPGSISAYQSGAAFVPLLSPPSPATLSPRTSSCFLPSLPAVRSPEEQEVLSEESRDTAVGKVVAATPACNPWLLVC